MKTNKAFGFDKISARLLKDSVDVTTPSLTNLQINIVNYYSTIASFYHIWYFHRDTKPENLACRRLSIVLSFIQLNIGH